ncbi:hypothetical protein SK128_026865 [Halocaridina rubra]|uniref:Uncharacterized protein n=1 Tax=Halocaridina rubra TaxID=373956 RepID=A0AAN8WYB0_HALRR
MAVPENQRALSYSSSSFPFPVFNDVFFHEVILVSLFVICASLVTFSYLANFATAGKRRRREVLDEGTYQWPALGRRHRPMLHILTRVLLAVTEGLERYKEVPSQGKQ